MAQALNLLEAFYSYAKALRKEVLPCDGATELPVRCIKRPSRLRVSHDMSPMRLCYNHPECARPHNLRPVQGAEITVQLAETHWIPTLWLRRAPMAKQVHQYASPASCY